MAALTQSSCSHGAETHIPKLFFFQLQIQAWLQVGHPQCPAPQFSLLFFFGLARGMQKFPGQRSNLSHGSGQSHSSDKVTTLDPSLTARLPGNSSTCFQARDTGASGHHPPPPATCQPPMGTPRRVEPHRQSFSNSLDSSVQWKNLPLKSCTATTAKMNMNSM